MVRSFEKVVVLSCILAHLSNEGAMGQEDTLSGPHFNKRFVVYEILQGIEYALVKIRLAWIDAALICTEAGGVLTDITSQEEYDFLANLTTRSERGSVWVGAANLGSDIGSFTWISSKQPVDKDYWINGQPDASSCARPQNCVLSQLSKIALANFRFYDSNCERPHEFICKANSEGGTMKVETIKRLQQLQN